MDSHTLLANKVFGMCQYRKNACWPLTLFSLGYGIHSIEKTVSAGKTNVSPDIILVSRMHGHALVVECKSGANVDRRQDRKYGQIALSGLHKAGVPAYAHSHTPTYAINEEHVDRIRGHTGHSLVVFGSRRIYGIGDFGSDVLTRELQNGINLKSGAFPDVSAYPFSIRDTHDHIDARVASAILFYLNANPGMRGRSLSTRALAGAILRVAHPLHSHFSGPHRSELRRAVAHSIARQEGRGALWLDPAAGRVAGPGATRGALPAR